MWVRCDLFRRTVSNPVSAAGRGRSNYLKDLMRNKAVAAVMSLLMVALLVGGCKSSATSSSSAAQTSASSLAAGASATTGSSTADCPSSNTTNFAKTKFVLHAGLAFGAFHRYLYKPFQAGTYKSGAHGRILAFVKAGLAALYIKREVRLAYGDVTANPTLCKVIAAPLRSVGDDISAAVTKLKGGDPSGITAIQSTVTSVESSSSANGDAVQEDANAPLK